MKLTKKQIEKMRILGALLGWVIALTKEHAKPGVTLRELDRFAYDRIRQAGVRPAFLNYKGYQYATCISVNDAIVHGIPTDQKLKGGDVVGIDIGITDGGLYVDSAITSGIGTITLEEKRLLSVTERSLAAGIKKIKAGVHLGDAQHAIERVISKANMGIVRDLCGHGIGTKLQAEPRILNLGEPGSGPLLTAGMALAIEPMVTLGDWRVVTDPDNWTVRTKDGSQSAHFEHTIVVTKTGAEILTVRPKTATLSAYARELGQLRKSAARRME